jgi:hypothetical protein
MCACKEEQQSFTEHDIPDLTGYVIIVTGGMCSDSTLVSDYSSG